MSVNFWKCPSQTKTLEFFTDEPLKFIKIEAKSSKEVVYVAIDGQKVFENVVTDDNGRGIHVVVLNQNTGVVMATRRFDTYYTGEDQLLISFCNLVQEGRIVIFMIKVRHNF